MAGNYKEEWTVYLLQCADMSLYCGITRNLERRLAQHNGQIAGGARYTRGRGPVEVLGTLVCEGKSAALKMEAAIKAMPRSKRLGLFNVEECQNPRMRATMDNRQSRAKTC